MCRSIHTLYNVAPAASEEPSRVNEAAFERAVDEIASISWRLLGELETTAAPRVREHVHV